MLSSRVRVALSLLAGSVVAACGGSEPTGTGSNTPAALAIVSGDGQVGLIGQTLSVPLVVKVSSTTAPIPGVAVTFNVTSGSATLSPTTANTDATGQAKTLVTFGSSPGTVSISATVSGTSLVKFFALTAGTSSVTAACSSLAPTTPGIGNVVPGLPGTGICLGGGATGAEYAIVAFNSNPDTVTGTSLPMTMTSHGAAAVATASVAPSFNVVPGAALSLGHPSDLQSAFDMRLREIARRELAPKVPAALARLSQTPSFSTIPANPAVGTLFNLNANGQQACTSIKSRVARVAAVSNSAIVVADTTNPAGGFTDAEYQSFATTFDTLINPLDVSNFGQPTDIDKNGKILIFFTKEVNLLTPRGSGGVIGGFFFERDLFPLSDTQRLRGVHRQQLRRDVLRARAGSECGIRRRPLEVEGPRRHARHARPRIPAPDQRRPPDVREPPIQ